MPQGPLMFGSPCGPLLSAYQTSWQPPPCRARTITRYTRPAGGCAAAPMTGGPACFNGPEPGRGIAWLTVAIATCIPIACCTLFGGDDPTTSSWTIAYAVAASTAAATKASATA